MIRYIELNDRVYEYELIRKDVKNLNLRVHADGRILVSANPRIGVREVDEFIQKNAEFVLRSIERFSALREQGISAENGLCNGGAVPVLGVKKALTIVKGNRNEAQVLGDRVLVTLIDPDSEEAVKQAVRKMLEQYSKKLIPGFCKKTGKVFLQYGIHDPELKFRRMVSRWGSCCPATGTLTFNTFLICVPPECIEYVVTHEFAHFLIADHSPAFHQLMSELMPDWKIKKKMLEPYGALLHRL